MVSNFSMLIAEREAEHLAYVHIAHLPYREGCVLNLPGARARDMRSESERETHRSSEGREEKEKRFRAE